MFVRPCMSLSAISSTSVTRRLIAEFVARTPATRSQRLPELSPRETEVLSHLAQGQSNREIAGQLFLGEATVKSHVGTILMKLGCRDRVQAVVMAYEQGLVGPAGG
jgi:DNA-binding NarL/FixJ family response regulator